MNAGDGAVLPILNLNGYKIANPTILARISHDRLQALFHGYGYTPYFVEGDDPEAMHQQMAATLDAAITEVRQIQKSARDGRIPIFRVGVRMESCGTDIEVQIANNTRC